MNQNHYLKTELYEMIKKDSVIFDFLQENSLDGMWYWDLENPENEWISPRFWQILGYNPKEKKHLVSQWQEIIFPEDLKKQLKTFTNIMKIQIIPMTKLYDINIKKDILYG